MNLLRIHSNPLGPFQRLNTLKYKVRYEKKTDPLIYLNVIHIVLSTRDLRKTKTNNKQNLHMASSLGLEQERNSQQESFFQNCSTHTLQSAIFGSHGLKKRDTPVEVVGL